jgi:hypothetical protein
MPQSAAQQLESFIDEFTPDVAATARAAIKKLRKQVPPAIEMVYDNYNALVVGFAPSMRASEAILSVATYAKHVSVCFLHGAKLADPQKLLQGSGNQVRHIKLTSAADLDRPEVRDLVAKAVTSAPAAFDRAQARQLIIKSISPKRRPRRPLST